MKTAMFVLRVLWEVLFVEESRREFEAENNGSNEVY